MQRNNLYLDLERALPQQEIGRDMWFADTRTIGELPVHDSPYARSGTDTTEEAETISGGY